MRLVLLLGVLLGVFLVCTGENGEDVDRENGEAIDGEDGEDIENDEEDINIDIPMDDQEENDQFIEDVLGEDDAGFDAGDDGTISDAPVGDETGDLSAKDRAEILKDDDESDIVRDEDHVIKAVKEELEEEDFSDGDMEALMEPMEGEKEEAREEAADDRVPDVLAQLEQEEKKRAFKDAKKEEQLRAKQKRLRRIAQLREMKRNRAFNGTLDISRKSRIDAAHDPNLAKKVRDNTNQILKKQRQRKKYADGKHKVTATVKIDPMITIKGGKFKMGTNDPSSATGEYPVRNMAVKPFKLDRYPVTAGDFAIFKRKKFRYKTDAEKRGFSWVFFLDMGKNATRDTHRVLTGEPWWFAVADATFDKPGGVGTNIVEKMDYPAVHVSYHDAAAFCLWAGKRLPTEYEWEYAARGGKNGIRYPWGDKFERNRTNLWQGLFPMENKKADGHLSVSPVNAYKPQNDYGLYDMVGNVWEWTSSPWTIPKRRRNDPEYKEPDGTPRRNVVRGGSFVDSRDGSINYEARCGNRKPVALDFSIGNLGFRCAQTVKVDPQRAKKKKPTTPAPTPKPRRQPKVHRLAETWTYKMKQMLEDIMHGGKESASAVMEKLQQMRKKEEL